MSATQPVSAHALEIRRTIAASPEKVFEARTRPETMARWFCRTMENHSSTIHEVDLRVGGLLRVDVVSPEGKTWKLRGQYREIKPAEKLVFTWSWENVPEDGNTLVTVEFRRLGQSNFTEVLLRHEGFPSADSCKSHTAGWDACLLTLETVMASA